MKIRNRREVLRAGFAGLATLAAGCRPETYFPPSYGSVFDLSNALTMSVQRLLLFRQPLAPEYGPADISPNFPTVGTVLPEDAEYQWHLRQEFTGWRLPVVGRVQRELSLSLADLKRLPSRSQVTAHSCERGWTAIAGWTGVPLSLVLEAAGLRPEVRYIVFECHDGWYDSLDLFDAFHAQTILAYGMNGGTLPVQHGAPVRLRVERQLGYKSVKFVKRVIAVDTLDEVRSGKGSIAAEYGYSWYAGI